MTNEQCDAMLNEGIYPDGGADTHSHECDCEDCEPIASAIADALDDEEVSP